MRCFDKVDAMIKRGYPLADVARFIHGRGEYGQAAHKSLVTTLHQFRASLPPAELLEARRPAVFLEAERELQMGLDELSELHDLYRLHRQRLDDELAEEKRIGRRLPGTRKEFDQARKLLIASHQLKNDLGLIRSASTNQHDLADVPPHIVKAIAACPPHIRAVIMDPESRRRVLTVIDKILSICKRGGPPYDGLLEKLGAMESPAGTLPARMARAVGDR